MIRPLNQDQIRAELSFICDYLTENGYSSCEILFGFAWGNEYYKDDNWNYIPISIKDLIEKVSQVGSTGIGSLGSDDLYIRIEGLSFEFQFCHESDIHILFDQSNTMIEWLYERWKSLGYSPVEWQKSENGKSAKQIKIN